jgi:hypothetical protein
MKEREREREIHYNSCILKYGERRACAGKNYYEATTSKGKEAYWYKKKKGLSHRSANPLENGLKKRRRKHSILEFIKNVTKIHHGLQGIRKSYKKLKMGTNLCKKYQPKSIIMTLLWKMKAPNLLALH